MTITYSLYVLATNSMKSLLLNGICVNLIGIYCFWSYVQMRNEILFKIEPKWMAKHSQYCLGTDETQEKEKKSVQG